ncbi:MAG: tandem-95 repeat protein, partial [Okeania sp. SIO3B5]|uniref:FG-GAP-like repeat-containing protein n=1 Tax=Okeania sp. SIO3B5 TaxID=2607811 RepID=UPI0013FF891B
DDTATTAPNTPVTFSISDNDENVDIATIDLDPETPGIQKNITAPGEGTFAVDDDGNVTFTPVDGFEGEASIPYTADDTEGNSLEPADITVTVEPVPELTDDTANTPPNTPVTFSIIDNDENVDVTTIDLDPETPGIQKNITVPGEGTFSVDDDGNVTFTPLAGFEGEASIPYGADDTNGNSLEPADISVTVEPIPELTDDTATTLPNTPVTFSISDNDENVDIATIDLDPETPGIQKNITVPGEGTFSVDDDGNVTFTPLAGFDGESSIPYGADDTNGNSLEPANIIVDVTPIGSLVDDTTTTPANTPVTFNIAKNDTLVDATTIDLDPETPGIQKNITIPGEGTFAVDDDGNVTFTPVDGFEGEASIPYGADDTEGNPLEPADITVNVAPIVESSEPVRFDFDGDGKADILWRNQETGQNRMWLMDGTTRSDRGAIPTWTNQYELAAAADFDGDGKADILWRNQETGQNRMWLMDGTTRSGRGAIPTWTNQYELAAAADFDGDGKADILWRNQETGQNRMWLMDGTTRSDRGAIPTWTNQYEVAAAADFDGDGKADILWRNQETGQNRMWLMDGITRSDRGAIPTWTNQYEVAAAADFDGDGKADILWRNQETGQNRMWLMDGTTRIDRAAIPTWSTDFEVATVADFNGDGNADILWRDQATGQNRMWLMDGITRSDRGAIPTWSTDFEVVSTDI